MRRNNENINQKIWNSWNKLGKKYTRQDQKQLIKAIARDLDMPNIVVEKQIGDWQSGKTGKP